MGARSLSFIVAAKVFILGAVISIILDAKDRTKCLAALSVVILGSSSSTARRKRRTSVIATVQHRVEDTFGGELHKQNILTVH